MRKPMALIAVVLTVGMAAASLDAEARRLGGARSSGMQRQSVTAPANTTTAPATGSAATQTAPAAGATGAAAGPTAAAATQRSWMGPIAGIAAGLGIAALASHFGFGGALANMLTVGLLVMLALGVVGFLMRKRMATQGGLAAATGAGGFGGAAREPAPPFGGSAIGSRLAGGPAIPADFDKAEFERTARDQFIALQAANDARDLDRLRDYLSPEMYEVARAEIAERGGAPQKTEVFGLRAQVLGVEQDADRYVVSVRFTGSIREQAGAQTEDLHEVWHLTKPKSGLAGWVIAGIQQAD